VTLPYDPPVVWAVIVAIGVVTFCLRYSFVFLFGRVDAVPPRLSAALRYVPPAVLAALVAPAVLGPAATGEPGPLLTARTAAAGVATLVAWRTGNMLATIVVGMVALWAVQAL
jgi:branched-subunit amino acid transport protein